MAQAPETVPESGLVAGRYRPLRPLGTGGSGSVWLARDDETGLEVALKIVPKEGKAASRAEREAQAAARLRHPHVLRAYGFGSDARHVYIPYEYVPGHTLRVALRGGELDEEGALEAAAQVLHALAHAHAHGIVHRDVKPSNVLVANCEEVSVRLFDFGLAQLADAETLTAIGDVPGTLAYISPERLRGEPAGPPADVWAVGVLVWEALTGQHPFFHDSPFETGKQIQAGAPSLASARPDLPKPLIAVVDQALSVDPDRRPTAAAFARALRAPEPERESAAVPAPGASFDPRALERPAAALLAAFFAGWMSATLPFYPARWPFLLAGLAAALTAVRPRLGLAFALAVPVLPLGNFAFGLALVYAALACGWLVLAWPRPRSGLLVALGALFAPLGALGLLPLAFQRVDGWFRRGIYASGAVLAAGVVAGLRGGALPFTGGVEPGDLGLAAEQSPLEAAGALWRVVAEHPSYGLGAIAVGSAAAVLPWCLRAGELAIAALGAALAAGLLVSAPDASAWAIVLSTLLTCGVLAAQWRIRGGGAARIPSLDTLSRATSAFFVDRLKPVGGSRWPRRLRAQRLAHAVRR